ncbi:hypothetical protein HDV00_009311 [Rhizophlyctis rosea]|nr:hypothetical protein HDV00_009311 [Rhizophlyctis rosea]
MIKGEAIATAILSALLTAAIVQPAPLTGVSSNKLRVRFRPRTPFYINLDAPAPDAPYPPSFQRGRVYDFDLFNVSAEVFKSIAKAGGYPICYFSAGTAENFRPDYALLKPFTGNTLPDFPDEAYLDIRRKEVRKVMIARIDLAKEKGCVAVDPDNVDEYQNDNGLNITAADQLDYNRFLANEADKRGLACGLKNDPDQVPELVNSHDFVIAEQCLEFDECAAYTPFIQHDKAVFAIEYNTTDFSITPQQACPVFKQLKFNGWIQTGTELVGKGVACP